MNLNPYSTILLEFGFKQLSSDEYILEPFFSCVPKEQWGYNNTYFTVDELNGNTRYRFFDKNEPDSRFGFNNNPQQLTHILQLIKQGKTVFDLALLEQELRQKHVEHMLGLQEKKPFVEDYRYINIGGAFFEITAIPGKRVYMTYEKHAASAYFYTVNDISNLEHAKDIVQTGSQSHAAISFWFLAFESYINSLIKLCCIKKNEAFAKYKKQDLHVRVGSLVRLLELDIKTFFKTNIIAKINEFTCFRNELFHDRYSGEELKFIHTQFSPIPMFSCQVDILQSVLIFVETALQLRFAIDGLDTMPSVVLRNKDIVVWEKLDVAYEKILQPWFIGVLDKHRMQTRLQLDLKKQQSFTSSVFQKGDIFCMITVDQEPKYEYWLNPNVSNIGESIHTQHLASYNLQPGTMLINKVTLQ